MMIGNVSISNGSDKPTSRQNSQKNLVKKPQVFSSHKNLPKFEGSGKDLDHQNYNNKRINSYDSSKLISRQ